MELSHKKQGEEQAVHRLDDPPIAKATIRSLFTDVRWAPLWLILRVYLGWQWLGHGLDKLQDPAWTGDQAGAAITGFVNEALTKTGGEFPDVQGWYAWFLQNLVLPNAVFWSYLVAWGETLVAIALIVGFLTGIAAFFGTFMNLNYLLGGSVSTNPILFTIGILLIVAWKTAGWWGLDRWVLPMLGRPLRPRPVVKEPKRPTYRRLADRQR
jgi:thiosulfate dehydrogenase [quinone] large subunit